MLIFTFPLWILGACGRMGFKWACDMIRVVFCVSTVLRDGFERNKTLERHLWLLGMSSWRYQIEFHNQGEGQADSLGTYFNFIINAGEGFVMMQGARRRAYSGALERVEEEWQEKSEGPARTGFKMGEEEVWGREGRSGKGVKCYGDKIGQCEMSLRDVTMVNDVCCFCYSRFH